MLVRGFVHNDVNYHVNHGDHDNFGNQFRGFRVVLFYLFALFVLIRIWMIVVATNSVTVVSVAAVITSLIVGCWVRWRYLHRRREQQMGIANANDRRDLEVIMVLNHHINRRNLADRVNGLSPHVISQLKTVTFTPRQSSLDTGTADNTKENEELLCSICLTEFMVDEVLTALPCNHMYHKLCVSEWLSQRDTCPLCKQQVVLTPVDPALTAMAPMHVVGNDNINSESNDVPV